MKKKRKSKADIQRVVRSGILSDLKWRKTKRDRLQPDKRTTSSNEIQGSLYPFPPGEAPW